MNKAVAEDGIDVAREFYGHIASGEFEEAKELLAPEFVVHEPRELPYGGEYHGFDGFLDLLKRLTAVAEIAPVTTPEFAAAGDRVMVRMIGRFTSPTSGRSVDTGVLELVSFHDGRIAELDVFYKGPGRGRVVGCGVGAGVAGLPCSWALRPSAFGPGRPRVPCPGAAFRGPGPARPYRPLAGRSAIGGRPSMAIITLPAARVRSRARRGASETGVRSRTTMHMMKRDGALVVEDGGLDRAELGAGGGRVGSDQVALVAGEGGQRRGDLPTAFVRVVVVAAVELVEVVDPGDAAGDRVALGADLHQGAAEPGAVGFGERGNRAVEPGGDGVAFLPGHDRRPERRHERVALPLHVAGAERPGGSDPPEAQQVVAARHQDQALRVAGGDQRLRLAPGVRQGAEAALGDRADRDQRRTEAVLVGRRVAGEDRALGQRPQDRVRGALTDREVAREVRERERATGMGGEELEHLDDAVGGGACHAGKPTWLVSPGAPR